MPTVAITGSSGFIGSRLAIAFASAHWRVIGLSRTSSARSYTNGAEHRRFELTDASAVDLSGVDVLVHCALEPYDRAGAPSHNVDGSRRLFEAARIQGVRQIVFFSSFSASPITTSPYGLEKFAIEALLEPGDLIVRPGLVVGGGGVFQAMSDAIRRLHMAPLFLGGTQPVYTIDIDELVQAIVSLVVRGQSGVRFLAAREPVTLKALYQKIAAKSGVRILLIPLPFTPMLWLAKLVERFGGKLPVSSGSMLGLPNLHTVDVPHDPAPEMQFRAY